MCPRLVFQTGRAARIDDFADAADPTAQAAREFGLRAVVGVPISVEGRLWGVMIVGSHAGAAAAGHRGPAGRVHRAGRHRDRQRPGPRGAARVRRRAGRAAAGSDAGRPRRRHRTRCSPRSPRRPGGCWAPTHASMSRYGPDGAATVVAAWDSTGTAVSRRQPVGHRRAEPAHAGVPDRPGGADRRLRRRLGPARRGRPRVRPPLGCRRADQRRRAAVGRHGRRVHAREPLPAGTEARLAGFTELAATAIANAQARVELRGFADEQAALRRVATLVARAAPPEEVLAAVTEEAGRLLHADYATMNRYGPDGTITVVAAWSSTGAAVPRRHPVEYRRAEREHAGVPDRPGGADRRLRRRLRPGRRGRPRVGPARGGRRAGQRRGPAVGRHVRGLHRGSRCRPAPRRGWPGSPNWPPPRSPTPRPRPP